MFATTEEQKQFACMECGRGVSTSASYHYEVDWFRNSDSFEPMRFHTFGNLQQAGLCQVCKEHQAGVHLTGFQSNCLACQIEKRQLARTVADRLTAAESDTTTKELLK